MERDPLPSLDLEEEGERWDRQEGDIEVVG